MLSMLSGKTILITGGTGSFGRSFTKFLLKNTDIHKLIILSRDEFKQFNMQQEIDDPRIRFFLGDVRDLQRLNRAFHGVDIVIHAAALKQIPLLEYNPIEAVKTNIIGTQNVIDAAIDEGVEKVLLVSSDKAAQPINLYGATKLCAEKLIVQSNVYGAGKTIFSCVRYGNVIGSRGSIVETLLKGKRQNVTQVFITHEEMTRFWISLRDAHELVMFALEHMVGGEVFVPKIASMKLVDLFDVIVPNVPRVVIGIRPGEKLHEMLIPRDDARRTIELSKHHVVLPEQHDGMHVEERYGKFFNLGKRVGKDFSYSSDVNTEWFTRESLAEIVNELEKEL